MQVYTKYITDLIFGWPSAVLYIQPWVSTKNLPTYIITKVIVLTLKVLVATIDAQWEGMGDVESARYEPALLPPCPTIRVLSCSN